MIVKIGEHNDLTQSELGGKGYNLSLLKSNGFQVPDGFILTVSWFNQPDYQALFHCLQDKLYSVRSSAIDEDGNFHSFAGLQETYLNVSLTEMENAIKNCYASQWSERAESYRKKSNLPSSEGMAVIIQEMVDARISGVAFTQHPLNNRNDVVSIDAISGLGDAFVSGLITPSHYEIHKLTHEIITKEVATIEVEWPFLLELTETVVQIEALYGIAQDIEWSFSENQLYILQSRPITTVYPVPISNKLDLRFFFSFGHAQNMALPITPLGINMIQSIFIGSSKNKTSELITTNGPFCYVDLTDFVLVKGFPYKVLKKMMVSIDRELPELVDQFRELEPRRTHLKWSQLKTIMKIQRKIFRYVLGKPLNSSELNENIEKHVNQFSQCKSLEELSGIRHLALIPLVDFMVPIVALGMLSFMYTKRLFKKYHLEEKWVNNILAGVQGNITTEMGLMYGDLLDAVGTPNEEKVFNAYVNKYGMRTEGEIDLGRERISEHLLQFKEEIHEAAKRKPEVSPRQRFEALEVTSQKLQKEILDGLPWWRRKRLNKWIQKMLTFSPYRELPKYTLMRIFNCYRPFVSTFSPFMTIDEYLKGGITEMSLKKREAVYNQYRDVNPKKVVLSNGLLIKSKKSMDAELHGTGVSVGRIKGCVRVLLDKEDSFSSGEILVTRFTDPGWTPKMALASGLIIEVGGMMTHGAVVAREYGIPAIVGVENATQVLKTGDLIIMDGETGSIYRSSSLVEETADKE